MKALLIIALLLAGCDTYTPKRPFVVTSKYQSMFLCTGDKCVYRILDVNQILCELCDSVAKYSIGDTIK